MTYRTRGRKSPHPAITTTSSAIASFSRHAGALLVNRMILKMAFGFVNVFVPVLLYQLFGIRILGVYILISLIIIICTPISARLLAQVGVRKLIALSVPFAAMSVWALSFFDISPVAAAMLFAILFGIHHSLYWVPYHVNFAEALGKQNRGVTLGWYEDLLELVSIATPLIGAILIVVTGFNDTLLFVSLLCFTALLPVLFIHETYERFSWTYLETFRRLFHKKNRKLLIGYGADGAQLGVATVLWPIFLFEVLNEKYIAVGIVTTLSLISILLLNILLGRYIDKYGVEKVMGVGVLLSMSGWLLKAFVGTPFEVYIVDTYHKFGDSVARLSRNVTGFSGAADSGHYIDEYTTIAEISYQTGKILMFFVCGVLLTYFTMRSVFICAALVTLFLIVFKRHFTVYLSR